jgi:hypothetical protein
LLSYDPDDMTDPFNLIKQCPNCKEYWMKVSGCDSDTWCGRRADYLDDYKVCRFKAYTKYVFRKVGNAFSWIKSENKTIV